MFEDAGLGEGDPIAFLLAPNPANELVIVNFKHADHLNQEPS